MTPAAKERIFLASAVLISLFFLFFRDSSFNDTLSLYGLDAYSIMTYDHFSFRKKSNLEKEISELKTSIAQIHLDKALYENAVNENKRLREMLSIEPHEDYELVYARTVGRGSLSYPASIVVNAGKNKNVSVNDAVITKNGVAGYVIESGESNSRVRLVSHPSNKIAVRTELSRAHGILVPYGQNSASVEEITKRIDVTPGENIYTADHSLIFPGGLLIARVTSVSDSSATINKIVRTEFVQDTDLIEDVFIMTRKDVK